MLLPKATKEAMVRTWGEQVTPAAASRILGVSRQTIYNWEDAGMLKRNGCNRFFTRDIISIMEAKN